MVELAVLQVLVFSNGRRVVTDLPSEEAVSLVERHNECFYMDPMDGFVQDIEPVPGSPYDLYQKLGGDDAYYETLYGCPEVVGRDQWDDVCDHLERGKPKCRRRKPLPVYHHKRWGHGNSREMINRVGQFAHIA